MMNLASFPTQVNNDDLLQADAAVKEAESQIEAAKANLESRKTYLNNMRKQLCETQLPLLIAQFKALGISVADLGLPKKGKGYASPASTLPPKYRDPITGKTWSGRGNKPKWIDGHDLSEGNTFLIQNQPDPETTHLSLSVGGI